MSWQDLLNAALAILAGAISGGITANIVIKKHSNSQKMIQKSKGDRAINSITGSSLINHSDE